VKVLSLFSGIGGLDLAAEWAGMEIVAQCEIDPYCQSVLRRHWPNVRLFDDIRTVTADSLGMRELQPQGREQDERRRAGYGDSETSADADFGRRGECDPAEWEFSKPDASGVDLITGGFPCQPVSSAGKRRGKDDDRWLWPEMLRVIREIQPAWVVGENVAGLISMGLDDCLSDLEKAGYSCQTFVIPACAVNAIHRRDRVFIVAHAERGGQPGQGRYAQSSDTAPHENRQANRIEHDDSGRHGPTLSRVGDMDDGLPAGLVARLPDWCGGGWAEPARLKDTEPGRVNMLRALGNAVVPQQAEPIFRAIMEAGNA